jgi:hypothetical protein
MKSSKLENYRKEFKQPEKISDKFFNKFEYLIFRYTKPMTMGSIELLNNSIFHFLDTIKVRLQAKNIKEDIALFTRNRVTERRISYLI